MKPEIACTVLFVLTLSGCAKTYHPLTVSPDTCLGRPVCVRVERQSWEDNARCEDHATNNRLRLYRVTVTNKSEETVAVKASDVKLTEDVIAVGPSEAQYLSSMLVWPYVFWFPLFVGPVPVGIAIGAGNMLYANHSNGNLMEDLTQKALPDELELKPGESKVGLKYLLNLPSDAATLTLSAKGLSTGAAYTASARVPR